MSLASFSYIATKERLAGTQDLRSAGAEAYAVRGFYGLAGDRIRRVTRSRQMDAIPWFVSSLIAMSMTAVSFVVSSAGPDGKEGTADDIVGQ